MASAPGRVDGAVRVGDDAQRCLRLRGRSPRAAGPAAALRPRFQAHRRLARRPGTGTGSGLAFASGSSTSGLLAVVLALVILGYDAGLKHTWLGPAVMGACRGLEPASGNVARRRFRWARRLAGRGRLTAIFVAGITHRQPFRSLWRRSKHSGGRAGLSAGGHRCPGGSRLLGQTISGRRSRIRPIIPLEGLLVLALVALAASVAGSRAIERPSPNTSRTYVKTSISEPGMASRRCGRRRPRTLRLRWPSPLSGFRLTFWADGCIRRELCGVRHEECRALLTTLLPGSTSRGENTPCRRAPRHAGDDAARRRSAYPRVADAG